jgi:hypothetical protein
MTAVLAGACVCGCGAADRERADVTPWQYVRLAGHLAQDGPVLSGDEVLVGSTRRGQAAVTAYPVAGGSGRLLHVPGSEDSVADVAASEQAVAVETATYVALNAGSEGGSSGDRVPAAFGPPSGPLGRFPEYPDWIGVAGPFVLSFELAETEEGHARLTRWDVSAPSSAPRELPLPPGASAFVEANGGFAAVFVGRQPRTAVVVMDVGTGAEVYRVPAEGYEWGLAPDGRLVALQAAKGGARIVTATPADHTLRTIATAPLATQRFSAGPAGAIVARLAANGLAQLVLVGYDGSARALTPPLNGLDDVDADATHVTFNAGHCVFAGPIPAGDPGPAPRDACFDAHASTDSKWAGGRDQIGAGALRVRLLCQVPLRARCRTRLRLRGPGFTVNRRVAIGPGPHVVSIPIPSRRRRAARRSGMTLTEFDHGRATDGMVIPQ